MQRIDLYFQKQYNRGSSSVVGTLRSRIEAVITGRTRNALALRGTRVRIPPTPREHRDHLPGALFTIKLIDFHKILPDLP